MTNNSAPIRSLFKSLAMPEASSSLPNFQAKTFLQMIAETAVKRRVDGVEFPRLPRIVLPLEWLVGLPSNVVERGNNGTEVA